MKLATSLLALAVTVSTSFAATNISNEQLSYSLGYSLIKGAQTSKVLGTDKPINSEAFLDGVKLAVGDDSPKLTEEQVRVVSFMMGYMTGMSSVKSTKLINNDPAKQNYDFKSFIKGASDKLENNTPKYKVLSNQQMKDFVDSN